MHRRSYIRRNHRRPLFARRSRTGGIVLLLVALLLATTTALVYVQADSLQLQVLAAFDMAPTSTPFAGQRAANGVELFRQGDLLGAVDELEMAVQLQPSNIDYLYEYGQLLIELVDMELRPPADRQRAAEIGQQMMDLSPGDPRGYALRARALMWSDPTNAIPVAVTGLELNPNFAPLHAALAVAYTQIGRYAEALQRGARAVELDPLDATAHRSYSIPLIITGRVNEAIEQLEAAIRINPALTAPYFELAAQYRRINLPEMAVAIYQRVLEIDPTNARAYLRMCETYAAAGEFQTGEIFCYRALEINPDYASAHRMLGQIQYTRRNYESSIVSFNRCVELGSQEIECYYLRGLAHYRLGECEDAWIVLQDALSRSTQELITQNILFGLDGIRLRCTGYSDVALPTPMPATPIPPTPIGGV